MSIHGKATKVTTHTLQEMKRVKEPITMLTAYDYSLARLVDGAGVDVILVGDSASNVMAGQVTTVPMTLDHMIYHAQCVQRAVDRALIVVDMPFGSYQGNSRLALDSAVRIMKEAEGHAVKLEGGSEIVESIERILTAGIPVMGHLGLTPQSIYKFGTYSVRAKEDEEAEKLIEDAKLLEKAGCFAIVLEKIPKDLAQRVQQELTFQSLELVQVLIVMGKFLFCMICLASPWTSLHDSFAVISILRKILIQQFVRIVMMFVQATSRMNLNPIHLDQM
jgi:3-methyl-2-oxobutanoate hydroxymethyltransferase